MPDAGGLPLKKDQPRQPAKKMQRADLLTRKLGRRTVVFEVGDLLLLLRAAVEREGGQSAFARRHGIERTHLNHVLTGKRRATDAHARAIGLRRVYIAD
jgi:DNA-binding phage protein